MAFFRKVSDILRMNIVDFISQSKSDDPDRLISDIIREMDSNIRKVRNKVNTAIEDQDKLQKLYRQNLEESKRYREIAVRALHNNDESASKEALNSKNIYDKAAREYARQLEEQSKYVNTMKIQLNKLDAKLIETKRKRNLLKAQNQRLESMDRINQVTGDLQYNDIFEQIEDNDFMEEALAELDHDTLEYKFREISEESFSGNFSGDSSGDSSKNSSGGSFRDSFRDSFNVDKEFDELKRSSPSLTVTSDKRREPVQRLPFENTTRQQHINKNTFSGNVKKREGLPFQSVVRVKSNSESNSNTVQRLPFETPGKPAANNTKSKTVQRLPFETAGKSNISAEPNKNSNNSSNDNKKPLPFGSVVKHNK